MRFNVASISTYAGSMIVAAALLAGACSSDGKGGTDAGGGSAAAGAGGRGGAGAGGNGGATAAAGTSGGAGTMGAGGTGGAAGTTGSAGGGGAAGAVGSAGRGGSGGAGGMAGGGVTGVGGTNVAGCIPGNCGASGYCDMSSNLCIGGPGICKTRPLDCTMVVPRKTCACDGNVYNSECDANFAGQDVSGVGGCTAPSGTFACGPYFCAHGTEYCVQMIGGAITNPGTYQCLTLPAGCGGTPTCTCLSGSSPCGVCMMSGNGDLTSSCLFP